MNQMEQSNNRKLMIGLMGAFTAYLVWGLQPIYWKTLVNVDPWEVIAHRYCWSAFFLFLFVTCTGQMKTLRQTIGKLDLFNFVLLILVSLIAVLNWWINIFAPIAGHVVELGIGLFLTPIMSVVLGVVFYRERLSFYQKLSVLLAVIGVCIMLIRFGQFPWIALGVSATWAVYGALKKKLYLQPSVAIFLETIIVAPFALIYLIFIGTADFITMLGEGDLVAWALIGTAILTSVPLITYTYATNYLPLNMLGFCQYISPTLTLCLGIFVYHESFGIDELLPMLFVWGSIALFFYGQVRGRHLAMKKLPA